MARKCTICEHKRRNEIDSALVVPGAILRTVAHRFGVSIDALKRHVKNGHVVEKIAKAGEAKQIAEAGTLLDQVKDLSTRALNILTQAEGTGDLRTACSAIREVRSTLELLLKVSGELKGDQPVINIGIMVDAEKIIGTDAYREYERRVYAELAD